MPRRRVQGKKREVRGPVFGMSEPQPPNPGAAASALNALYQQLLPSLVSPLPVPGNSAAHLILLTQTRPPHSAAAVKPPNVGSLS